MEARETSYDAHDTARLVAEPAKAVEAGRGAFERDRARVLHSAALRRLAAKTQVVGVGESDFPRTRLTHSLECAQIGREIAAALGADPDLVDAAGLAHDLGHPPFGHNGEVALDEVAAPVGGFEGNAQTFRVLTRLEAKVIDDSGRSAGLNLTRAMLDAASKYPWSRRGPDDAKYGVYREDLAAFTWMREGALDGRRCLEAQIMDWADDVAYSVHDLEDGVHAGHVRIDALADPVEQAELVRVTAKHYSEASEDELAAVFDRLLALEFWPRGFDGSFRALAALKRMTSELIARFSAAAVGATREAYGAGALTRFAADLVVPAQVRTECAVLKAVAARYVMWQEETQRRQARQRDLVRALADAIVRGAPQTLDRSLVRFWREAPDDAARLRVVVDQVASLTDTSALAWHARLVGA